MDCVGGYVFRFCKGGDDSDQECKDVSVDNEHPSATFDGLEAGRSYRCLLISF